MRWALVVCGIVAACEAGPERQHRWPDHRRIEEQRIADLEREVAVLRTRVQVLEATLRTPPAPPHEVDAPAKPAPPP